MLNKLNLNFKDASLKMKVTCLRQLKGNFGINRSKYFCTNNLKVDEFDIKICNLSLKTKLQDFHTFYHEEDNKMIINKNIEKKILFLDYLSTYSMKEFYNCEEETSFKQFIDEIAASISYDQLKFANSIYVVGLIDSLSKLDYYPTVYAENSKIWILLESIVNETSFLNSLGLEHLIIILKSFQKFFNVKETTVNPEELFETIEYYLIMTLKSKSGPIYTNLNTFESFYMFCTIYVTFGVNLEASTEFYNLLILKLMTKANLNNLMMKDKARVVELLFASLCINKTSCRGKVVENFISDLASLVNKNNFINNSNLSEEGMALLEWCNAKIPQQISKFYSL